MPSVSLDTTVNLPMLASILISALGVAWMLSGRLSSMEEGLRSGQALLNQSITHVTESLKEHTRNDERQFGELRERLQQGVQTFASLQVKDTELEVRLRGLEKHP